MYVEHFNGADIQDMDDFAKPIIRRKASKIILQIGTNEIAKKSKEAEQMAQCITILLKLWKLRILHL